MPEILLLQAKLDNLMSLWDMEKTFVIENLLKKEIGLLLLHNHMSLSVQMICQLIGSGGTFLQIKPTT